MVSRHIVLSVLSIASACVPRSHVAIPVHPADSHPWERAAEEQTGPYAQDLASDEPFAHWATSSGRADGIDAFAATDPHESRRFSRHSPIALGRLESLVGDEVTVELWTKLESLSASLLRYGDRRGATALEVRVDNGRLGVVVAGEVIATPLLIERGEFHHVAVSWSVLRGELRAYVDGRPGFGSATRSRERIPTGEELFAGASGDGEIDEVVWHERVLPRSRILSHVLVAHGARPPATPSRNATAETTLQSWNQAGVTAVGVSPDGRLAITSAAGTTMVWETRSGRLLRSFNDASLPLGNAVDPTGRFAIVQTSRPTLLDLLTGESVRNLGDPGEVREVVITPDGARAVLLMQPSANERHWRLRVVDLADGRDLGGVSSRDVLDSMKSLSMSPDGSRVAFVTASAARGDMVLEVVELGDFASRRVLAGGGPEIFAQVFIDGGRGIAALACGTRAAHSDCANTYITVVDVASGGSRSTLSTRFGWLSQAGIVSDGGSVVAFASGPSIVVWDVAQGVEVGRLESAHPPRGSSAFNYQFLNPGTRVLALSEDGALLVSSGDDERLRFSRFPDLGASRSSAVPLPRVAAVAFVPVRSEFIAVDDAAGANVFSLSTLERVRRVRHDVDTPNVLALDASGHVLLVAGSAVLSPEDLPEPWRLPWRASPVYGVPTVGIFQRINLQTGEASPRVLAHVAGPNERGSAIVAVALSGDGSMAATGDERGVVQVFDSESRLRFAVRVGDDHARSAHSLALDRGGELLAIADTRGVIQVFLVPRTPALTTQPSAENSLGAEPVVMLGGLAEDVDTMTFDNDALTVTRKNGSVRSWRITRSARGRSPTPTFREETPPAPSPSEGEAVRAADASTNAPHDLPAGWSAAASAAGFHAAIVHGSAIALWTNDRARSVLFAANETSWVAYTVAGTFGCLGDGNELLVLTEGFRVAEVGPGHPRCAQGTLLRERLLRP